MLSMPMPPPKHPSPISGTNYKNDDQQNPLVFDASVVQYQSNIPPEFIWPDHEKPGPEPPQLLVPPIDLKGFLTGNTWDVSNACRSVDEACKKHGFFLLVNHGVDSQLITKAHKYMDLFFGMQLSQKQRAQRKIGEHCGYASSFVGRFSSKLPWKETLTFRYCTDSQCSSTIVKDYIADVMGEDFSEYG